jgi:hypothetical protein
MTDHHRLNSESRRRLHDVVGRLDTDALRQPMGEHWTIGAGLLHLAFWDRFTRERWSDAERAGLTKPRPIDAYVEDLINDTLTPLLLAASVEMVGEHALEAAQAIDDYVATLPAATIEQVMAESHPRLVDRSIHRLEHVAEIESLLAPD